MITLIGDPDTELWLFYRYLTSTALFERDKIIIVLTIPTLRVDKQYEVYSVINVPTALHSHTDQDIDTYSDATATSETTYMLASYDLEAEGILIDKQRSRYVLLTSDEMIACSHSETQWCEVSSPVFPVNLAKVCVISL